jgi:hypothetical protein
MEDFPKSLSLVTIKKVLDISTIVSICDFVDAYLTRKTKAKDGASDKPLDVMLKERYPEETEMISFILKTAEEIYA